MRVHRPHPTARMLLCGAVAALVLLLPGHAFAAEPAATEYAPGSPAMVLAQSVAVAYWGTDPCGGQVTIAWTPDVPSVNARSAWYNPVSTFGDPELNSVCSVTLNSALTFTWAKLCTIVVHEYGHLTGHPHTVDGPDVMSPTYHVPLPACVAADPDPSASVPVPRTLRGGHRASAATAAARRMASRMVALARL
jgi:hypothetical protein